MAALKRVTMAVCLFAVSSAAILRGEGPDAPSEYQVKAAFLFNFAKFVEWPAGALGEPGAPILVGIFGWDPFGGALDQIVRGKTVNGRPLEIRRTSDLSVLRSCHVLFISASEMRHFREIAAVLGNSPVMTVGESDGFAERGGVINFVVHNNRIRFQVNLSAAVRTRLKISSRLLQLAIVVRDEEPGR